MIKVATSSVRTPCTTHRVVGVGADVDAGHLYEAARSGGARVEVAAGQKKCKPAQGTERTSAYTTQAQRHGRLRAGRHCSSDRRASLHFYFQGCRSAKKNPKKIDMALGVCGARGLAFTALAAAVIVLCGVTFSGRGGLRARRQALLERRYWGPMLARQRASFVVPWSPMLAEQAGEPEMQMRWDPVNGDLYAMNPETGAVTIMHTALNETEHADQPGPVKAVNSGNPHTYFIGHRMSPRRVHRPYGGAGLDSITESPEEANFRRHLKMYKRYLGMDGEDEYSAAYRIWALHPSDRSGLEPEEDQEEDEAAEAAGEDESVDEDGAGQDGDEGDDGEGEGESSS